MFLPLRKYSKLNSVTGVIDHVLSWQSKGLSNENIKSPTPSDNNINLRLNYYGVKISTFHKKLFKTAKFYVYS